MLVLGTHSLRGEACTSAVDAALRAGYRRIDTASAYRNERNVGAAIAASGLERAQLYLTTKVGPRDIAKGRAGVIAAVRASLAALRTDYLDCVLMHWPGAAGFPPADTAHIALREAAWAALHDMRRAEVIREVGASNFLVPHLAHVHQPAVAPVQVVQLELHPWCQQREIVAWATNHGARLEAYGLFGAGVVLNRCRTLLAALRSPC